MRGDDKRWRLTGIVSWGFGGKGKLNFLKRKFKKFFNLSSKKRKHRFLYSNKWLH